MSMSFQKSILRNSLTGVRFKRVPSRGDLPDATRLSRKSVPQRSVPQRCSTKVSCTVPEERLRGISHSILQERLVGFLLKGVFTRVS